MGSLSRKALTFQGGAVLLLLIGIFASAGNTHAGVGLTIQPLKVSHTVNPGESVSGAIQIINASDDAVDVETKVEDFVPLAGTYNIQFVGRAPGITTVRDWITLDAPKSFALAKGATKDISYTIQAPSNAEPGGHFGVAFFKASQLPKGGQQLKVGTQVGMLILVTVPGSHLEKGRILDFSGPLFVKRSPIHFTIRFENTGTVHFEPKGTITITNMLGKEIGSVGVGGQVVLPTGTRDLAASVSFEGVLAGRYKANVKMFDGDGNELTAETIAFYAFPIWYAVAFLVTVVTLFFLFKLLKRNVRISISRKT
ncbi:hypothetical protein A3D09_02235 [Candidatus Collierbacteria bacterium RIFCSPHIGHO2_02_FULL_49_10]|uniref:DUF916 domain-containing protein n=1 Tax=Candidatus Collierbacteria bacterium RIFCSPHIGHO2_02_FULL_49_10 TaxID=1817723 RepID=A0A1F5EVU8_9BACT|nr:MAG: hypothetical protein A3D09_02235 [Candidatus Collierbacteria bacterium RIFCSPHIGHO2_02_FULL_49_10]